jgi:hypothetical protein
MVSWQPVAAEALRALLLDENEEITQMELE